MAKKKRLLLLKTYRWWSLFGSFWRKSTCWYGSLCETFGKFFFNTFFLQNSARMKLISLKSLSFSRWRNSCFTRLLRNEKTKNLWLSGKTASVIAKCNRIYHQTRLWYRLGIPTAIVITFGYDLYMLTASDSENDLPVFPFLSPASRHDSHGFYTTGFPWKRCFQK